MQKMSEIEKYINKLQHVFFGITDIHFIQRPSILSLGYVVDNAYTVYDLFLLLMTDISRGIRNYLFKPKNIDWPFSWLSWMQTTTIVVCVLNVLKHNTIGGISKIWWWFPSFIKIKHILLTLLNFQAGLHCSLDMSNNCIQCGNSKFN